MLAKKNSNGHGYKYSDIAEITKMLAENGIDYFQELRTEDGEDYIYTTPIIDGKELTARRGCKLVKATLPQGKANPVQEYGSALTYCRRYSLMMAFGIAPTDDDGEYFTNAVAEEEPIKSTKKRLSDIDIMGLKVMSNATEYSEEQWCRKYGKTEFKEITPEEQEDLIKRMQAAHESKENNNGKPVGEN